MAYDLGTAYARTGLTQNGTNDTALMGALNAALAMVEQYLDRLILFEVMNVEVLKVRGGSIQVSRFPIERVQSIRLGSDAGSGPMFGVGSLEIHNATGTLLFMAPITARNVTILYAGGYRILPADLELALWATFDAALAAQADGGGATAGGTAGPIESVTLQGVGTVRFASGSSSSGSGGSGVDSASLIPAWARSILWPYRLEAA